MTDDDRLMLLRLLIYSEENNDAVFELIDRNWEDGMIAPIVEIQRLISDRVLFKRINTLLKEKTGQRHNEFFEWMDWLWEAKIPNEPYYPINPISNLKKLSGVAWYKMVFLH